MPDRPLILFPDPVGTEKVMRFGGGPAIHIPSYHRQVERLQPMLDELGKLVIQYHPGGIEPEYTLVFETTDGVDGLYIAMRHLNQDGGVADLFELPEEGLPGDDDFYQEKKGADTAELFPSDDDHGQISCKLFCVSTNVATLTKILSLWKSYSQDESFDFPGGETGLRSVFQHLRDVHRWGTKERLTETGIIEAWREDLLDPEASHVRCEIELHFRNSAETRTRSEQRVCSLVTSTGGEVIRKSCIEAIAYHALLVMIPRQSVERILEDSSEVELVQSDEIMFFRPAGQAVMLGTNESSEIGDTPLPVGISDEPIIALFDGLPQENHPLIRDFLIVDDPEDYAGSYLVQDRRHGTSMASLIARGDLGPTSSMVTRKIYVRPIMKPYQESPDSTGEHTPDDVLLVDKIHDAVRRLYEVDAGAVAPSVKVINLSIGIRERQFDGMMSPLARLLDWLSWKYKVLFIVSAGNHPEDIDLGMDFDTYKSLPLLRKDSTMVGILANNSRRLRLLSPAESMNSLTIGALFRDKSACNSSPFSYLSLPCSPGLPSPISSLGRGLNRSIKPDLLYDGGRDFIRQGIVARNAASWRRGGSREPGVCSAAPTDAASGKTAVTYSSGTSNSAALISHEASHCFDVLGDVFRNQKDGQRIVPPEFSALLLKAMLVHGAEWDESVASLIRGTLSLNGRGGDHLHKWLGYGIPDVSRVQECTRNRATLIGYGEMKAGSAYLYELPLPFDFHEQRMVRHLTVTLAYFTPIMANIRKYRSAQLWYDIGDKGRKVVSERIDASDKAVARGTIQHERFRGDGAIPWDKDDGLSITVNCRRDACEDLQDPIQYSLFVSFEIEEGVDVDVYQSVAARIREEVSTERVSATVVTE